MKTKMEKFYNNQANIYLHADRLTADEWIQAKGFIKRYSVIILDTYSEAHLYKIARLLFSQAGYKNIEENIKNISKYLEIISRLFALYAYVAYKEHNKSLYYENHINNNLNEIIDLIRYF